MIENMDNENTLTANPYCQLPEEALLPAFSREVVQGRAVVIHDDCRVDNICGFADVPYRRAGEVRLLSLKQFSQFVKGRAGSTKFPIFVNPNQVCAVFNYTNDDGSCGWGDDTAVFDLQSTPDWKWWNSRSGDMLDQSGFCDFVEEHQTNIVEPNGADLLNMISNFRQMTHVSYGSAYRTVDGQVQLEYKEDKKGITETLALPSQFVLNVPVIQGAETMTTYRVTARLRWRVDKDSAQLRFSYSLIRPDIPELNAVSDLAAWVADAVGPIAEVYEGKIRHSPADILCK